MDLSNMLSGVTGGMDAGDVTKALTDLVQSQGGVDGLMAKLRAAGLGGAVDSWVSTGSNQAVDGETLGSALGPDAVNQLAATTGLDVKTLLPLIATLLPMVIDHLTPGGALPQGGGVGDLGGIGDLIGGVLGGGGLGGLLGGK